MKKPSEAEGEIQIWRANILDKSKRSSKDIRVLTPPTLFEVLVTEDEEGDINLTQVIVPKSISFDIKVFPERPRPGSFGAVLFAKPFRVKEYDDDSGSFLPLEPVFGRESEYPSSYFDTEGGKVVIKITIEPEKFYNTEPVVQRYANTYLEEAVMQRKIFNAVYGPSEHRYDVPLSPCVPYMQFATIMKQLPSIGINGMDLRIRSTIAKYFFLMWKQNRGLYKIMRNIGNVSAREKKDKEREFITLFEQKGNYSLMRSSYRMGMVVQEYAGMSLDAVFLNKGAKYSEFIRSSDALSLRLYKHVTLPVIFQMLYSRAVLNTLGYIHADVKSDNIVLMDLASAHKHSMYHTKTGRKGEVKHPLFTIDIPNSSFSYENSSRIIVDPFNVIRTEMKKEWRDSAMIVKIIDFGRTLDEKKNVINSRETEVPKSDVYKTGYYTFALAYRPPESFIHSSRNKKMYVYHISDTFAMGVTIFEVVCGLSIGYIAEFATIQRGWEYAFGIYPRKWNGIADKQIGWMIFPSVIRHILFVCLDEIFSSGKGKKRREMGMLFDTLEIDESKYFRYDGEDYSQVINWDVDGLFTIRQRDEKLRQLKSEGMSMATFNGAKSVKEMESRIKGRYSNISKMKKRITYILGEEGIYMLLKLLHIDPLKRTWAKEALVEQLQSGGIFRHMIRPEEEYYKRLKMLGYPGNTRYNLGLYKLSLDIARIYSQKKLHDTKS